MFDLFKEVIEEWGGYSTAEKTYWVITGMLFAAGFIAFSWWYWVGMIDATSGLMTFVFGGFIYLILGSIVALLFSPLMAAISFITATFVGISSWLVGLYRQART